MGVEINLGDSLPLYRSQKWLRSVNEYNIRVTMYGFRKDSFTLEENAARLDSITALRKGISKEEKWLEYNKVLILAQYN